MSFVEELRNRGLLHDIMPGTEEQLQKEVTSGYIGFDPTADSLHIGNLVPVILLKHLQNYGHKPIVLIGGATGMVGDPSGKSEERNMLDLDIIQHNLNCQRKQLEKFLNFNDTPQSAEVVNNYDWFKNISFLEFIRDAGKHISVNYMMAKDSVKKRLETGMSFTEFSYQLVQGYDFYWLYKNKGVKLQMGGSDQWGNIVTGTELIRRKTGGEAFAITAPLITKHDGSKFGKSEKGNVWIDPNKTSTYQFYQFWLNVADEDAERFIRIFTFLPLNEIENLILQHKEQPHLRLLQKKLAAEVTTWVHDAKALENAIAATEILFGNGTAEHLKALNDAQIEDIFEGVPVYEFSKDLLTPGLPIINALAEHTQIFSSKGEARRMLQSKAVMVNKSQVDESRILNPEDSINGKFIIIQKGKKNYHLIKLI
jgi:tyrosyl-tRNA synthetase